MMDDPLISIWLMTCHIDTIHRFLLDSLRRYLPLVSRWNHTDFLRIIFRLMMGKAHIDMTQGCRIDMIGCSLSYRDDSYWNDVLSRIDMSLTLVLIWPPLSYRYVEGKEDFVPSVISQSESHISYHFDWKDWRSLTSFLGLSHRWNDRSFWARKGAIDETANLRPKTLNLLSFQSDRRFLKKLLLKSS